MSGISDAIGDEFERQVQKIFPDWTRIENGNLMPDFETPFFFAEAKAGFCDYGVQIKDYQISAFTSLSKPVIYILGYHNFDHALRRLQRKSDEKRAEILRENMSLDSIYILEQDIVEAIWDRENKLSKSEGRVYCTLKRRFPDSIIDDLVVKRNGRLINSRRYYGINCDDLSFHRLVRGNVPVTAILKRNQTEVADYFKEKGMID